MRWTASHCHLPSDPASTVDVLAAATAAGVERIIDVGTTTASSQAAIERAAQHDGVWATAGVHPHDATEGTAGLGPLLDTDQELAVGQVVAIGECGLDYHYDHSPREVQRQVFAGQIAMAHGRGLPLVIHTREAWDDTFAILDEEGLPEHTLFHCFSGGPDEARKALDRGGYLSFSGIVTFKTAHELREAAELCPLDRILVETDSPYLAPVPHRGKPNVPANVAVVGTSVAATRGCPVEELAEATWTNATRFYGLPE